MPPPSIPRLRKPAASAPAGDGTKAAATNPLRQLRASDLRAVARLATQATSGISRVAEGVHQSVLGTLGLPGGAQPGRTRGLTGLVYQSIRGVTQLVDVGLQAGLARLETFFAPATSAGEVHWEREAVIAALNGVMGDRLQRDCNPLCTRMGWYQRSLPLDLHALAAPGSATGKLLVLVHGLCMNVVIAEFCANPPTKDPSEDGKLRAAEGETSTLEWETFNRDNWLAANAAPPSRCSPKEGQ